MEKKNVLGLLLMLGIVLSSCSRVTDFGNTETEGEQGLLSFTLTAETNFANTRAVVESSYKNVEDYTVVVEDRSGMEVLNCKGYDVASKMPLILSVGDYTVRAFYGVEASASRDTFYVCGETQVYIKPNEEESTVVTCTPTCGRVRVEFNEEMPIYFNDYKVDFTGTKALKNEPIDNGSSVFAWDKDDTEPWYVKLEEEGEAISFTITTTTKEEFINVNQKQVMTKSGTFTLDRNKGYKLKVAPSYTATGKVGIAITIDESTNDKPVDVEVPFEWI